jgi:response regulator RpfG family c-di-GMP phosphodiesterase
MELKQSHTLLLVDDEESITKSLIRLFRKANYNIHAASSGKEALEILDKIKDEVSLIISDQRMPGMSGAEFLEKAKTISPNAIRFLLTGYSDMEAIVYAINKGEIHRYLNKPWNDQDLLIQVHQALENLELKSENKRLNDLTTTQQIKNDRLEKGIVDAMKFVSSLVEKLNPLIDKYMSETTTLAKEIAMELNVSQESLKQIEIAAMIYDIGLLELPKALVTKEEEEMTPDEFGKYKNHPVIGKMCIQSVQGFDEASEIISYHHENIDGSGFPRGLMGDEIPLGSRILAAAADYCRILAWPKDISKITNKAKNFFGNSIRDMTIEDPDQFLTQVGKKILLLKSGQKYDIEIVSTLIKILTKKEKEKSQNAEQIMEINLEDLCEGMTLGKNLRSKEGRILLRKDTSLIAKNIDTLKELFKRGFIDETIHINASQDEMARLRKLKMDKIKELERVTSVTNDNLREGMIIAKNIRTIDGYLLYSKGVELNKQIINKINELIENKKMTNIIYINPDYDLEKAPIKKSL